MRMPNEIKAGVVIIIGVAAGMLFFAKTAKVQTMPYEVKTYFKYAGDLKNSAVVKLSGIEVGHVSSIKFIYDNDVTKVECTLAVNDGVKIRKDATAFIGTAGFVGDAYIGIADGTSAEFAVPGTAIPSEEPLQMRELMKKADKIADNLDKTLTEFRGVAADVKTLTNNVNGLITDNRPGIKNIVNNLDGTTQNLKEFSEDVKKHPWKLLFKGE